MLDERVCCALNHSRSSLAHSLSRTLSVCYIVSLTLASGFKVSGKAESFFRKTIPGCGDIWTPHNGWIEDKVLNSSAVHP